MGFSFQTHHDFVSHLKLYQSEILIDSWKQVISLLLFLFTASWYASAFDPVEIDPVEKCSDNTLQIS